MKLFYSFLIATSAFLATSTLSFSQDKKGDKVPLGTYAKGFNIKGVKIKLDDKLVSPTLDSGKGSKKFKEKTWLSFDVDNIHIIPTEKARATLKIGKDDKFLDNAVVSFYVLLNDPDAAKKTKVLLSKNISHVDIPIDEPTSFIVFLSPTSIKRLFGGESVKPSQILNMGYEVKYGGQVIFRWSQKPVDGASDWWNISSRSIVKEDGKYPLLNKNETPFALFWWDKYPSIKSIDSNKLGETLNDFNTSLEKATTPEAEDALPTEDATAPKTK